MNETNKPNLYWFPRIANRLAALRQDGIPDRQLAELADIVSELALAVAQMQDRQQSPPQEPTR